MGEVPDTGDMRQNLWSWVRALGCQECNPGYDYTMTNDELSFG
jgi:hypothetical protein